ncbi:hypothetical protein ORI89_02330 [Sphingobacterium sp. UT-1RO-CII-1]|uniref:DUF6797 domain-containing protein n=1 Tax=Sphingobacterium sp. UT-1RO-CII-1 TaxID=2995225 RepID=UPI00227D4508|nr:DUF6797 domain-containing protein [Sphingobacterium sp. UT-1RO-CII-1]MCY4778473.1 hypothetical protein [Sphingobacterium sp. UT-1RO-CII-1]
MIAKCRFVFLSFLFFLLIQSCQEEINIISSVDYDSLEFNDFVEPEFPFINTSLDLRNLGEQFPKINYSSRATAIQLGNQSYMAFDPDLLRWSAVWTGGFVSMTGVAQVSYKDFFNKNDSFPRILGEPMVVSGLYPGWTSYFPNFKDVRTEITEADSLIWGPLNKEYGRYQGMYTVDDRVVVSYLVNETQVYDSPTSKVLDGDTVLTRTIRIENHKDTLYTVLAEMSDKHFLKEEDGVVYIHNPNKKNEVTAISSNSLKMNTHKVHIVKERFVVLSAYPTDETSDMQVSFWKGDSEKSEKIIAKTRIQKIEFPNFKKGGNKYWKDVVYTKGMKAPDSAAYVVDQLTLPMPNPWKRNVRAADIAFFKDGRAALLTFSGDVWIIDNINDDLSKLKWTRYASGFYEAMSVKVHEEQVYVFGREGIVRLLDLNNDGNADYYENVSAGIIQSMDSREWAADMVIAKDGSMYLAKGGGTLAPAFKSIAEKSPKGYRASTVQAGTILKISPDGETTEVYATGLRAPYIGFDVESEFLTASDQQGNYVPATPIYHIEKDDYFGVPPAAHGHPVDYIKRPLVWIPHRIDRSSISQLWLRTEKMGPLNNSMIHFSFGRPGLFSVLLDKHSKVGQAGVSLIEADYPSPVLKGAVHPKDGQVYIAGFNLWGSNSQGISSVTRMRYTGKPYLKPISFQVGEQGLVLSFTEKLDRKAVVDLASFKVKRWNYERTDKYGSGHFKLDGTAGEESLPVLKSYLSKDEKSVLLILPNMTEVMQMELVYNFLTASGQPVKGEFHFTVNDLSALSFDQLGFQDVKIAKNDLQLTSEELLSLQTNKDSASIELGALLFDKFACKGCHSIGTSTEGMYGPPLKGIFGSSRQFIGGAKLTVDDNYLKESILDPKAKIVEGYGEEMPSYSGVLLDNEVQSLVLYLKSL